MEKELKRVLFHVEQAIDLFKHRGLIEPDYPKVLHALISSMEAVVVMDDTLRRINIHVCSKNFKQVGLNESFVMFYWDALQFFIDWYTYRTNVPGGMTEERTEAKVTVAFVYLRHISNTLAEIPNIRSA